MNVGARVGWTLKDGTKGTGQIIAETIMTDEGVRRVLVAVDPKLDAPAAYTREVHPVICCTETWLTEIP